MTQHQYCIALSYATNLDNQHVDHPDVPDMSIFHKLFPHLCTASFGIDLKSIGLDSVWNLRKRT